MNGAPIGYLLKKFPRLSETFILNEMLGLERLRSTVHVFSRRATDPEPRHPQLADLEAEVIDLSAIEASPEMLPVDGALELAPRASSLLTDASFCEHRRFARLVDEALQLVPLLRARGIAHLHVHFATDSAIVAALARELGGPGYSVTLHAKDIYREGVSFARLERIIGGAEFAVTVCDANVRHLGRSLSARAMAKVRRLYNGIDLERFAPSENDAPRDADHVVAVGRLVEKKGFEVLVRAVSLLERRGVRVRATIAGDGDQRGSLESTIRELGLEDRVRLVGALDQAEVRALMARATVLCQPCVVGSDGNQDALPTVLLEAMASGLPTISTPVGGVPEILDDGRVGILVPPADVDATADALHELLASPSRREALASAGRARSEMLFDRDVNAAVLQGWLQEAAGQ